MIYARLFRSDRPPVEADGADWQVLHSDDANLLWMDLNAPADEEFAQVMQRLGIDPRAVATARRVVVRPGVQTYPEHYLVTARCVEVGDAESPLTTVNEIDILVGQNFLVSIHPRPLPFIQEIEQRTGAYGQVGSFDASYLLYVLLHTLVAHHGRVLEEVEEKVARLEERMLRDPGRSGLHQAVTMQRHVYSLRRLLLPHRETFGALVAADSPVTPQNIEPYFRDILANVNGLVERLEHARDIIAASYNLYISNITYRTSQQLRVLTFLSAILLPMTVITGLFGTNFKLAEYEAWEPFYVMLAGMGLLTIGMLAFFHWRRWL